MPTSLSKHPALLVRDLLVSNWDPSNTASYDPSISDTADPDYLGMAREPYETAGEDPYVELSAFEEGILGGGETGISAVTGDGTGVVQHRDGTGILTVSAESGADYNGETAADVVDLIRREIERIGIENPRGGAEFARLSTSFDGESTDADQTPAIEHQRVAVTYGWVRS